MTILFRLACLALLFAGLAGNWHIAPDSGLSHYAIQMAIMGFFGMAWYAERTADAIGTAGNVTNMLRTTGAVGLLITAFIAWQ